MDVFAVLVVNQVGVGTSACSKDSSNLQQTIADCQRTPTTTAPEDTASLTGLTLEDHTTCVHTKCEACNKLATTSSMCEEKQMISNLKAANFAIYRQ